MNEYKIGVDLGGTKIEVIVLDAEGNSVWRERIATPQNNYQATLLAIVSLVSAARSENSIPETVSVGIGTPGAQTCGSSGVYDVMKNCNSTALNGQPLQHDLSKLLDCHVVIENDANCFALAEARSGQGKYLCANGKAHKGACVVFGVILGTGVGSGIVISDSLLQGRHAIAGEWGHNMLPAQVLSILPESERGRLCYCGRKDCIETYLSGPGLSQSYFLRFSKRYSSEKIISNMRAGDKDACAIWQQYIEQLAASLSVVVNILDPHLIVLGGGLSTISEIYSEIQNKMHAFVFSNSFETPIVPAVLGDSAGVFGAAWLS